MIAPESGLGESDAIVVGAGLAGLSCAFELADLGRRVVVLEAQPWVGGRTASWTDSDGMQLESGLHRMLGVYTAFPALLRRAGIDREAAIVWEDEVEFRQPPPGAAAVVSVAPLRNPLQMLADVVGHNDYLSPAAKLSMSRLVAQGLADYAADPERLDGKSVMDYAVEQEVQPEVIAKLLDPLVAGIYFVPAAKLSAYVFMALIAPYLPNLAAMRVGAFSGGMTEVFAEPLAEAIRRRGGEVRTGTRVDELLMADGRVTGVRAGDTEYRAGHVVLASSLRATQTLLTPHFAAETWAQPLLQLPAMPAVTLQLELEGPATPVDRTTFGVGTSLACFSEQSRTTFRGTAGRLSIIMAPAEELIGLPVNRVLTIALEDADRLGLAVRGRIKRYRMVNHVDDFYSLAPGNEHRRPAQVTPVPGLTLAGDFTRQPFVATMEGAVVSGRLAADAVRAQAKR